LLGSDYNVFFPAFFLSKLSGLVLLPLCVILQIRELTSSFSSGLSLSLSSQVDPEFTREVKAKVKR
jgi:hypothetical protein